MDITIYVGVVLVVCIFGLLALGAVFLRLAAKWVQKMYLRFSSALLATLLAAVAHLGFGFGVVFLLKWLLPDSRYIGLVILPLHVVGFFLQSTVISWRLRLPYNRACLVTLVYFSLWFAVLLLCIPILIVLSFISMSGPEARQLPKPAAINVNLLQSPPFTPPTPPPVR